MKKPQEQSKFERTMTAFFRVPKAEVKMKPKRKKNKADKG
jgi:hypothetical protein